MRTHAFQPRIAIAQASTGFHRRLALGVTPGFSGTAGSVIGFQQLGGARFFLARVEQA